MSGAGTDVRFYAGNEVELQAGFEGGEGTTLEVVIGPPPQLAG